MPVVVWGLMSEVERFTRFSLFSGALVILRGDRTHFRQCTMLYSDCKISKICFKNPIFSPYVTFYIILHSVKFYGSPIIISRSIKKLKKQGKKSQIFFPLLLLLCLCVTNKSETTYTIVYDIHLPA